MRVLLTALTTVLMVATMAQARDISFTEAEKLTLTNSKMIGAYEAEAEAAAYRMKQAKGAYLPKLTVSETFVQSDEPGTAAFSWIQQGVLAQNMVNLADPDDVTNYTTKVELIQPVFVQGKIYFGIKQAGKAKDAADLTLERVRQTVLLNLNRAYFGLALADKALDVVKASYGRTEEYLNMTTSFFKNGMVVKSDLLTAESFLLKNEQALREAEKQQAVALSYLQRLVDTDDPLKVSWEAPGYTVDKTLDEYIKTALEKRQDLEAMNRYADITALETSKSKAGYLPEVALFANYQQNGDGLFGDDGKGTTVGMAVSWNVFDGMATTNKMREARSSHYAMVRRVADKKLEIKTEVREAYFGVQAAESKVKAASKRKDTSAESLAITQKRFREGLVKVTDLLDREVEMQEAELNLFMARYELIVQKASLLHAVGTLNENE